jgi:hypothetical protein
MVSGWKWRRSWKNKADRSGVYEEVVAGYQILLISSMPLVVGS